MRTLVTAFLVLFSFSLSAQSIFYYGNDSVSVKNFLRAYQKNNTTAKNEKAFRDYLDLYVASRLKIKEAKENGYDTLPQMVSDIQALRQQILPSYINDKEAVNKLVNEALMRSQKDIHVAHIFIKNGATTEATEQKKQQVLDALKSGDFSEVAKKFSDDPSAKTNGGDLGWISVFSLPYTLENLAYSTPVGKVSSAFQSKAGFHIFKNIGERKDLGKIKAAQILLAFPPEASVQLKVEMKKLADSIYTRLLKGDDFGKLATAFSNDVISAAANGQMQEFGVGKYESTFENAVFALPTDGAVSKPFLTQHGYHIVKRISKTPATSIKNEKTMLALKEKVEQSDRIATIKTALIQKIKKEADYKKLPASNAPELFLYSDSVLNGKPNGMQYSIDRNTGLIQFGNEKIIVADWIGYAQTNR